MGPQFFHVQTFSRKSNAVGQSVEQVLGEASRQSVFCAHVEAPQPPVLRFGVSLDEVAKQHDRMVDEARTETKLKDGQVRKSSIRKDRHTLFTAIASYPVPRELVQRDASETERYEHWLKLNMEFLKSEYGNRLVSVIEHVDEQYPHIHAYVLPLGEPGVNAKNLVPAHAAKEAAYERVYKETEDKKLAKKASNDAYKAAMREMQQKYYDAVGAPSGLTRDGPKRTRKSREQWKAEKNDARIASDLMRKKITDNLRTGAALHTRREKSLSEAEKNIALREQGLKARETDLESKREALQKQEARFKEDRKIFDEEVASKREEHDRMMSELRDLRSIIQKSWKALTTFVRTFQKRPEKSAVEQLAEHEALQNGRALKTAFERLQELEEATPETEPRPGF